MRKSKKCFAKFGEQLVNVLNPSEAQVFDTEEPNRSHHIESWRKIGRVGLTRVSLICVKVKWLSFIRVQFKTISRKPSCYSLEVVRQSVRKSLLFCITYDNSVIGVHDNISIIDHFGEVIGVNNEQKRSQN